jgi:hypothetical protein
MPNQFVSITRWKTLERHQLSKRYPDLKGQAWKDFLQNFRECGVLDRSVVIYEGMVLDGWQFYRACLECDLKPKFINLPKGMDPEVFVETKNDHRRHEGEEAAGKRIAERRERVAAAREAGKSLRAIADHEDIAVSTVQEDLEKESTVRGGTVVPSDGKVTGQDGRVRTATPAQPQQILCDRCQRTGPVKDCPNCEKARNKPQRTAQKKSGSIKFDDRKITDMIGKLARLFNDRAQALGLQKSKGWADIREKMDHLISAFDRWQLEQEKSK